MRVLDFIYDESGKPFAVNDSHDGGSTFATYYYVLNYQGDVVKLVEHVYDDDAEEYVLSTVASYTYNAWGEILTATGTMAEINPLRYRGYYYDTETGWYYLQSRYYDPILHRFINADSYASTGAGILGCNMFVYCNNNPIAYRDDSGHAIWPTTTVDPGRGGSYGASNGIYPTMDEAAIVAGAVMNILTREDNHERIAGIFYTDKNGGGYYMGTTFRGEHNSVSVDFVFNENEISSDELVALIHTHPYCTLHEPSFYSEEDFDIQFEHGYPFYLADPLGTLHCLYAQTPPGEPKYRIIKILLPFDRTEFDCSN